MKDRTRLGAIALIVIGIALMAAKGMGFFTIAALVLLVYGVYKIRQGEDVKTGYILLAAGSGIILLDHLLLVLTIAFIALLVFYFKAKKARPSKDYVQRHNFVQSIHWDRDPWTLRNVGMLHVLGELDVDLTLAIVEDGDNILMFQGLVGDLDLVLSEDYGLEIDAFVFFGRIGLGRETETGLMNRVHWRSPNYEQSEQKIKIIVSYLVGDVDIRVNN
ncbi:cell wall-active antibiotics response protein LiaF [Paenibacillus pinistramenti]|uniref:cell wall-active antibiotics response protein LiaF n=1 Tax=Paenibacillus pinistramenti TaxID=1768003 RepID=UPI001107BD57|nr:cell wall-active antibiotics response protein LiaF [Paenibacillus pinistramenti]